MKKLIPVLLALILAVTLVVPSALAAGTILTVNAPDALPQTGKTFTVTVDIAGNPGLCAAQFTLGFDKSVVACRSASVGSVLSGMLSVTNPDAADGAIIAAAATSPRQGDGTLGSYTFEVLRQGDPGFTLSDGVFTGENGAKLVTNVAAIEPEPGDLPTDEPTQPASQSDPAEAQEQLAGDAPAEAVAVLFSDAAAHWGAEYIQKAVALGLFTGYPDSTFHPDEPISRADFVTVLWRSADSPEPKAAAAFADVPADAYYAKAVAWANENGYVEGRSAGLFDPAGILQRQEAMKILYCYNGGVSGLEMMFTGEYDKAFIDSGDIAPWAKAPMYWAYYNNIISGVGDDRLSPATGATRAQIAKILVNYLDNAND